MNHDQGLDDLQQGKVLPSALNRKKSDPIQNSAQEQEPGFADQEAPVPAIGIPLKSKPNQILAGIPVILIKPTIKKTQPSELNPLTI